MPGPFLLWEIDDAAVVTVNYVPVKKIVIGLDRSLEHSVGYDFGLLCRSRPVYHFTLHQPA